MVFADSIDSWSLSPSARINRIISSFLCTNDKFLENVQEKLSENDYGKHFSENNELKQTESLIRSNIEQNHEIFKPVSNTSLREESKTLNSTENCNVQKCSLSKCSLYSSRTATQLSQFDTVDDFNYKLYMEYKAKIENAVKERKIFTVYGNFLSIRSALLERGWLEKLPFNNRYQNLLVLKENELLKHAKNGNDHEVALISKMLDSSPPYFIWQLRSQKDFYDHVQPHRNRIRRNRNYDFTKKDGLISCIENYRWHHFDNITDISVPKYHRLETPSDITDFLRLYRITYCLSLLQFLNKKFDMNSDIYSADSSISVDVIGFAIDRVKEEILIKCDHIDIDTEKNIDDKKWNEFIEQSNKIILCGCKLRKNVELNLRSYEKEVKQILSKAEVCWPTIHMDGYLNLWIIKPACQSRGCGIFITRNYTNIIEKVNRNPKTQYIVQKYIERPLLIYKTKFDIRQHILLTITENDVNIWFYKDCYLRFSSKEFSLFNLNESVHLTNNSVQKKYKNGKRSELLPINNMWTLNQFHNYLNTIQKSSAWEENICPKIKSNIISVISASIEETEIKQNAFELYGCDIMLDENLNPVLLEINSSPDMTPSTSVTAKLCPQVLKDLVKVIIDLKNNPESSTGNFELIHRISIPQVNNIVISIAPMLEINGKKMKLHEPIIEKNTKCQKKNEKINKKTNKKCKKSTNSKNSNNVIVNNSSSANSVLIANQSSKIYSKKKNKNLPTNKTNSNNYVKNIKTKPVSNQINGKFKDMNSKNNENFDKMKRGNSNFNFTSKISKKSIVDQNLNNSKKILFNKIEQHQKQLKSDLNDKKRMTNVFDIIKKSTKFIKDLQLNKNDNNIQVKKNILNTIFNHFQQKENFDTVLSSEFREALALKLDLNNLKPITNNSSQKILQKFYV